MTDNLDNQTHREVQRYYGETLESSGDLKTTACCTAAAPPQHVTAILKEIHPEVSSRYYGCGLVLPEALEGLRVLDLGCGAGRDVYLLSRLVGERGSVVGVDMTPAQLDVAEQYRDFHAACYGYAVSNVEFIQGNIERLDELHMPDASFDLIISNCVINLAVDKAAVLQSVKRMLKPGGEMYFSDIYADRRVPADLQKDPVLYGECLSGALYWQDFLGLAHATGFAIPRLVSSEAVAVTDRVLSDKLSGILFCSATYRLFRLIDQDYGAEDCGQRVVYRGSMPNHETEWQLDHEYVFHKGCEVPVCANTYKLLQQARFQAHFEFLEGEGVHLGAFSSKIQPLNFSSESAESTGGGCC